MIWEKKISLYFLQNLGWKIWRFFFYKRWHAFEKSILGIQIHFPRKKFVFSLLFIDLGFWAKMGLSKKIRMFVKFLMYLFRRVSWGKKTYFVKIFTAGFSCFGRKKRLAKIVSAWLQKLHFTCPEKPFKWIHDFSRKIVFFNFVLGLWPEKIRFL